MSAFICSNKHINTLVSFALKAKLRYTANRRSIQITHENAEEVANILADENARSVHHRYEARTEGHFGKVGTGLKFVRTALPDAVTVIKLCHCYDYQACETDDYETTTAAGIIRVIKEAAITALPGYDDAPWGI